MHRLILNLICTMNVQLNVKTLVLSIKYFHIYVKKIYISLLKLYHVTASLTKSTNPLYYTPDTDYYEYIQAILD